MLATSRKMVGSVIALGLCASAGTPEAHAVRYADTLGYFEPGLNVDPVFGSDPVELYDNALAALGGPGQQVALSQGTMTQTVSLGGWSDDPASGTNTLTPGLVVGFKVVVPNIEGDDLLIVGNAPSAFTFYEPGFVEVAIESDGGGAKPNGWQDETFYLLKPGNFDQITDPRNAPSPITITTNPDFSLNYSAPFDDDTNLPGYFDVTPGGDGFNLDDAIDINGDPVPLGGIAYVRLRSVSDGAFPFEPASYLSPEVDYLQVLAIDGDYNSDGFVGIADLNIVLNNWNQAVPAGSLEHGDGDGDGFVGIGDINFPLGNWNAGTPPTGTAVPEPATAVIVFGIFGAALSRRR